MDGPDRLRSSFRDPSGFLFRRDGVLYRQINEISRQDYDRFVESGLCGALTDAGLLVPHCDASIDLAAAPGAYRVIEPEEIPFVSYPYEWCFSELKDAALATLAVQKRALEHDMILRDASAYNVQFRNGSPVFIDTLSFRSYVEGEPWVAYRQFCQHFLAPLALMCYRDIRLAQLLRVYIDGIPLDLASRLLPWRTRLRFSLLAHLHLHARSQRRHAGAGASAKPARRARVSRLGMTGLMESLERAVKALVWEPRGSEWGDYYDETNYSAAARDHKLEALRQLLNRVAPATVWDLGANTGVYSRVAEQCGAAVVSLDVDPAAVEKNYLHLREERPRKLLPLVLDFTNPSGGVGWANEERMSLAERGPADAVLALALVHHLAISNNVPLERVADFLASLGRQLVIEFVPKEDSQVQRLLATREDVFSNYTREGFEEAFGRRFHLRESIELRDATRRLYLWERHEPLGPVDTDR